MCQVLSVGGRLFPVICHTGKPGRQGKPGRRYGRIFFRPFVLVHKTDNYLTGELATDESGSDSEALISTTTSCSSSSSSVSSLSDLVTELMSENEKRHSLEDAHSLARHLAGKNNERKSSILSSGLDVSLVYHPPAKLQVSPMSKIVDQ